VTVPAFPPIPAVHTHTSQSDLGGYFVQSTDSLGNKQSNHYFFVDSLGNPFSDKKSIARMLRKCVLNGIDPDDVSITINEVYTQLVEKHYVTFTEPQQDG
jgi:hypothetical protein